jgi:hypothetical protein
MPPPTRRRILPPEGTDGEYSSQGAIAAMADHGHLLEIFGACADCRTAAR